MPYIPLIKIKNRPFAIEPITSLMLPDGIFDASLYILEIACYITNYGDFDEKGEGVRIELQNEPTDDWVLLDPPLIMTGYLPAGKSKLVKWRCDFRNASPGKKTIHFRFGPKFISKIHSHHGYISKTIFVSRTSYNSLNKTYSCEVPEGILTTKIEQALYSPPSYPRKNEDGIEIYQIPSIPLPIKVSSTVFPAAGHENELPFNDPWWKVVAWIIFAVATLAAIIAAKNGKGSAGISITGHGGDDLSKYDWCLPEGKGDKGGMTEAGVLSIIAGYALKVGMADKIDPWQRGRNETVMLPGEVTVSERVDSTIEVPSIIEAGRNFGIPIKWSYHRFTNQNRELIVERNEIGWNEHVVENIEIDAPSEVSAYERIIVKIRMKRSDGSYFKGDEIYGTAVFVSPGPDSMTFQVPFSDSVNYGDPLREGWFWASLHLEKISSQFQGRDYDGDWEVLFFAQNVNDADEKMEPQVAATHIGGNVLVSPYSINLLESGTSAEDKSKKCPEDEKAKAKIKVVVE